MQDYDESDYDYGDYVVLARRQAKATRKTHACFYCAKEIAVGSRAFITVVLTAGGKAFSDYRHTHCPYA
jgi:hypothetical protein